MNEKSIAQRVNELLNTNYVGRITKYDWNWISRYNTLSEEFIEEFADKVNWYCISVHQKLSESFIRKHADKVNWSAISSTQTLSEDFIREFQSKVSWNSISVFQKLSEDFIREFQDKVVWYNISAYQKLSESFIREYQHKVVWYCISKYQKLSESFIREFQDEVHWNKISIYQRRGNLICSNLVSESFINEFEYKFCITNIKDSWHYKTTEEKKQAVIKTGLYECHEDYFIAYKGIRSDRYSRMNFQYQYNKGGVYESWCDCSSNENSFGLSVWDKDSATLYCKQLVVRVKVKYEDVGRVVHDGGKVRCFKIEILD